MRQFLITVVGIVIVIVLITLVFIPIFNQNKDMGLEAVSDMSEFKSKIKGDSVDGVVVLQYLRMNDIKVIVKDDHKTTISDPDDWVKEEGSFKVEKEYDENGTLDEVTFTQIDKSRTEN